MFFYTCVYVHMNYQEFFEELKTSHISHTPCQDINIVIQILWEFWNDDVSVFILIRDFIQDNYNIQDFSTASSILSIRKGWLRDDLNNMHEEIKQKILLKGLSLSLCFFADNVINSIWLQEPTNSQVFGLGVKHPHIYMNGYTIKQRYDPNTSEEDVERNIDQASCPFSFEAAVTDCVPKYIAVDLIRSLTQDYE